MKAVVLDEYGGPEKLRFEDNVPEPQISGGTVLIGQPRRASIRLTGNCVQGSGRRIFLCRFLQFWAAT
jgi:hypothetical protein